jgi:hypothetical protein
MNRLLAVAVLALAALQCAVADDKPSDDSIRQLMAATQSRKLIDGMYDQVDAMMQKSINDALGGQKLTAEQQRIFDDMRARMVALLKETMSWDTLEPMFIELYQKSFTQHEVDGMLTFYKSEPGKAVIAKMPLVMQHTMVLMQNRMQVLMPKVQELQRQTVAELTAAAKKQPPAGT